MEFTILTDLYKIYMRLNHSCVRHAKSNVAKYKNAEQSCPSKDRFYNFKTTKPIFS